jgi:hypothetical protein
MYIYTIPEEEQSSDNSRPDQRPQLRQAVYLRPDLRMFDAYDKNQLLTIEKYKDDKGIYDSMQSGHRNFLKNAVLNFYMSGHDLYARRIYKELQKLYPRDEFKVDYIVYVRNRLTEEVGQLGITDAREMVQLMLREAYFYYAMHEDDEAYKREKIAVEIHKRYSKMFEGEEHRIGLPPLSRLKYMALIDFLRDSLFPPSLRQALAARIRIERPDLSKQLEKEEKKVLEELERQQQTEQP